MSPDERERERRGFSGEAQIKRLGMEASPLEPTLRSVLSARLCRGCQRLRKWAEKKSIYAPIIVVGFKL